MHWVLRDEYCTELHPMQFQRGSCKRHVVMKRKRKYSIFSYEGINVKAIMDNNKTSVLIALRSYHISQVSAVTHYIHIYAFTTSL